MIERYDSVAYIADLATKENKKISELVLEEQAVAMELPAEVIYEKMYEDFKVMKESAKNGIQDSLRSNSGITGGDAMKYKRYLDSGKSIYGKAFGDALLTAVAVSEYNAAMGKIVASPTAGSCGILPSVLVSLQDNCGYSDKQIVMSLFTAAGVGMVIANLASISGAEGGCQAECGSASAMAAAAIVELRGGTPKMAENAVAIAIKNILGLVCDPVAGLVEVPCIKRNASGAANAIVASELALAGITSVIPVDEVIDAMKRVGDMMHPFLKETAKGGLAATPTGEKLKSKIFGENRGGNSCTGCGRCMK